MTHETPAPDFTERLRMVPLRESHAAAMLPVLADERLYRYIPGSPPASQAALAERYRRWQAGSPDVREQWLNWGLFLRADESAIGHLQATIAVSDRFAWVAYVLSPAVWGRGYATESVAWLLDHLRETGLADVARAQIDSRNAASLAVVERLGFVRRETVVEDGSVDFVYETVLQRRVPSSAAAGRRQQRR